MPNSNTSGAVQYTETSSSQTSGYTLVGGAGLNEEGVPHSVSVASD